MPRTNFPMSYWIFDRFFAFTIGNNSSLTRRLGDEGIKFFDKGKLNKITNEIWFTFQCETKSMFCLEQQRKCFIMIRTMLMLLLNERVSISLIIDATETWRHNIIAVVSGPGN